MPSLRSMAWALVRAEVISAWAAASSARRRSLEAAALGEGGWCWREMASASSAAWWLREEE